MSDVSDAAARAHPRRPPRRPPPGAHRARSSGASSPAAAAVSILISAGDHLVARPGDVDLRHPGRLEHRPVRRRLVPAAGRLRHPHAPRRQPVGHGDRHGRRRARRPGQRRSTSPSTPARASARSSSPPSSARRHPERGARLLRPHVHLARRSCSASPAPACSTWPSAGHRRRHPVDPARRVGVRGRPALRAPRRSARPATAWAPRRSPPSPRSWCPPPCPASSPRSSSPSPGPSARRWSCSSPAAPPATSRSSSTRSSPASP